MLEQARHLFTRNAFDPDECAPPEIPWLRAIGFLALLSFVVVALVMCPDPASWRGAAVIAGTAAFAGLVFAALPFRPLPDRRRLLLLVGACAVAAGMEALEPAAIWSATPYVTASLATGWLPPRTAAIVFFANLAVMVAVTTAAGYGGQATSIAIGTIPWFLFMRVMRRQRDDHAVTKGLLRELEASRGKEAAAAAEAERSRLAREMHDVLAHSLSALALQLESTRMLAGDRGADPELERAIERAHGFAATGLEESRRAIGALRGEELPGPQRIPALVEASGLPVALDVDGEPRDLPPDARLAVYRTAQEALTNVRRHAAANHVELRLAYRDDGTVLTVADHGDPPAAAPNGHGYGLTGMRERAELLGGRLSAAPTADGFRVELWLPA